jgi:hypothetical protein
VFAQGWHKARVQWIPEFAAYGQFVLRSVNLKGSINAEQPNVRVNCGSRLTQNQIKASTAPPATLSSSASLRFAFVLRSTLNSETLLPVAFLICFC